jgi:hypothetical protein
MVKTPGSRRETEMERMELYNGFRIRAYQDWSGLWLAETKKPLGRRPGAGDHDDTDAEYIATPSSHPTAEAAIAFIKQMIDSPSATR